jgi:hypothetical protein
VSEFVVRCTLTPTLGSQVPEIWSAAWSPWTWRPIGPFSRAARLASADSRIACGRWWGRPARTTDAAVSDDDDCGSFWLRRRGFSHTDAGVLRLAAWERLAIAAVLDTARNAVRTATLAGSWAASGRYERTSSARRRPLEPGDVVKGDRDGRGLPDRHGRRQD